MVAGIAVGGAPGGNGIGVSVGNGSVGTGVGESTGGGVFVGSREGIIDGGGVFVRIGTAVSIGNSVWVARGVAVIPGRSSWGLVVGCSDSSRDETIKTPTSSMAAPAFSNVILTNRALTSGNCVRIVSVCETLPLKPACSEWKTCAYST